VIACTETRVALVVVQLVPLLTAFVTKEGGNMVLRMAAERALVHLSAVHRSEAAFTVSVCAPSCGWPLPAMDRIPSPFPTQGVLGSVDAATARFFGDYGRKVLAKMDADSDDDE